jgi:hypothetical protein
MAPILGLFTNYTRQTVNPHSASGLFLTLYNDYVPAFRDHLPIACVLGVEQFCPAHHLSFYCRTIDCSFTNSTLSNITASPSCAKLSRRMQASYIQFLHKVVAKKTEARFQCWDPAHLGAILQYSAYTFTYCLSGWKGLSAACCH